MEEDDENFINYIDLAPQSFRNPKLSYISQLKSINNILTFFFRTSLPEKATLRKSHLKAIADLHILNPHLKYFHFNNTKVVHTRHYPYLLKMIQKSRSLRSFSISNLTSDNHKVLFEAVESSPSINSLYYTANNLANTEGIYLRTLLANSLHLKKLFLNQNQLGTEAAKCIAEGLKKNATLKELNLCYNPIENGGCEELGLALMENKTLKTLNLDTCRISDPGVEALWRGVKRNGTLETLSLLTNKITNKSCSIFFEFGMGTLKSFNFTTLNELLNEDISSLCLAKSSLRKLDISRVALSEDGMKHFANFLESNDTLENLQMNYCNLGDLGMGELLKGLSMNKSLKILGLNQREHKVPFFYSLAQALEKNSTLQHLEICQEICSFSSGEVEKALEFLFEKNRTLQHFSFSVPLSHRICSIIFKSLADNTRLHSLYMNHSLIFWQSALLLSQMLEKNTSIRDLSLHDTYIGSKGAYLLAAMLKHNFTLKKLCLHKNRIGNEGAEGLLSGLICDNYSIQELTLYQNEITDLNSIIVHQVAVRHPPIRRIGLLFLNNLSRSTKRLLNRYSSLVSFEQLFNFVRNLVNLHFLIGE